MKVYLKIKGEWKLHDNPSAELLSELKITIGEGARIGEGAVIGEGAIIKSTEEILTISMIGSRSAVLTAYLSKEVIDIK